MVYNPESYEYVLLQGSYYFMKAFNISEYLVPGRRAHLIGIGGVSMRPLGLVLKGMGLEVTGSDMSASLSTEELEEHGIHVAIGHRGENIQGADLSLIHI